MARIVRSPRAEQDIRSILEYTRECWGKDQALQYAELIKAAEIAVASDPECGWPYRGRQLGILTYPLRRVGKRARHVLFYRIVSQDTVEIVRLLHDAMDFDRRLL